jgi:uncharacterized protein YjbI with pentapeptide repeats
VSFTATVAVTLGGGAPTGAVQFMIDGQNVATVPLSGDTATSPALSSLSAGAHDVVATYMGTTDFESSAGFLWQIVTRAACTTLAGCNLHGLDLSLAEIAKANLSGANLDRANLIGTDLSGANLTGANLNDTKLNAAHLVGTIANGANLRGANLATADLAGANLTEANLRRANLIDVVWSNTICPDGTNSDGDGGTCVGHL